MKNSVPAKAMGKYSRPLESFGTSELILTGVAYFAAFVFVAYHLPVLGGRIWEAQSTRFWSSTPGLVVETKWVDYQARGRHGTSKKATKAEIRYRYRVGGREYESRRILLYGEPRSKFHSVGWLRRYPPGARPPVYYHPEDPSIAVLEKGTSLDAWLHLALLTGATGVLGYFGVRCWAISFRRYRPQSRPAASRM
jgi:hypothetical protein